MPQTKIKPERVLKYGSYYIDISCVACGVNILEYVERTNNPVYASASRKSGARDVEYKRTHGKTYRCKECHDILFGGVSPR